MKKFGKKLWQTVHSLVLFAIPWYLLYLALHEGSEFSWNLYRFMAVIGIAVTLLALVGSIMKSSLKPDCGWLPFEVSTISDVGLGVVLAGTGHFFFATLAVAEAFLQYIMFKDSQREPSKSEDADSDKRAYEGEKAALNRCLVYQKAFNEILTVTDVTDPANDPKADIREPIRKAIFKAVEEALKIQSPYEDEARSTAEIMSTFFDGQATRYFQEQKEKTKKYGETK